MGRGLGQLQRRRTADLLCRCVPVGLGLAFLFRQPSRYGTETRVARSKPKVRSKPPPPPPSPTSCPLRPSLSLNLSCRSGIRSRLRTKTSSMKTQNHLWTNHVRSSFCAFAPAGLIICRPDYRTEQDAIVSSLRQESTLAVFYTRTGLSVFLWLAAMLYVLAPHPSSTAGSRGSSHYSPRRSPLHRSQLPLVYSAPRTQVWQHISSFFGLLFLLLTLYKLRHASFGPVLFHLGWILISVPLLGQLSGLSGGSVHWAGLSGLLVRVAGSRWIDFLELGVEELEGLKYPLKGA